MYPSNSAKLSRIKTPLLTVDKKKIISSRRFHAGGTSQTDKPSSSRSPINPAELQRDASSTHEIAVVWDSERRNVVTATSVALFRSRNMLQSLVYLLRSFLTSPLHSGYIRLKHGTGDHPKNAITAGFATGPTKQRRRQYPREPLMWSLRKAQSRRVNTSCRFSHIAPLHTSSVVFSQSLSEPSPSEPDATPSTDAGTGGQVNPEDEPKDNNPPIDESKLDGIKTGGSIQDLETPLTERKKKKDKTPAAEKKKRKGKTPAAEKKKKKKQKGNAPAMETEEEKSNTAAENMDLKQSALQNEEQSQIQIPHFPIYTRKIQGLIVPPPEPYNHDVLDDVLPPSGIQPISRLAHGLERVLFNPGVHWFQDPRSGVYNFPPRMQSIPNVKKFAFERLGGYVTSSMDEDLFTLAKKHQKRFAGSTSSLSGLLSHIYFLLSGFKPLNLSKLSTAFQSQSRIFTSGSRSPINIVLKYKDGVYRIDGGDQDDVKEKQILIWIGTLLEKYLTNSYEDFKELLRSTKPTTLPSEPHKEAYRYSVSRSFVMRSQLDGHDLRLPGTGVFDIKTRAALPIRLDMLNYLRNSTYEINAANGLWGSFEREYYDMIRSAFLKYSFQARIGNMDGIFVAYHNTAKLLGFQYVPLQEMEECLYGQHDVGSTVFEKCVQMMEVIVEEIISCFPEKDVMCTVETRDTGSKGLYIFVQPLVWDDSKGVKPITEIRVRCDNFLRSQYVPPSVAVESQRRIPWSISWSITRREYPNDSIRENLQTSLDRQFRAFVLPEGVSQEEMVKIWKDTNFGLPSAVSGNSETPIDTARLFRKPDRFIEFLRRLSKPNGKRRDRAAFTVPIVPSTSLKHVKLKKFLDHMQAEREENLRKAGADKPEEGGNLLLENVAGINVPDLTKLDLSKFPRIGTHLPVM